MTGKRLIALLCAFLILFTMPVVSAEDASEGSPALSSWLTDIPDFLYYHGGIIVEDMLADGSEEPLPKTLGSAYAIAKSPYIVLNQPFLWDVYISGGVEPVNCLAIIAHQADPSMHPFEDEWETYEYFYLEDDTLEYTFTEAGRYFLEFRIEDAEGGKMSFQTEIYIAYTPDEETDATTVAGKINQIVNSLITNDMSDYSRALVLHDWLIYNANYDYTYTYHEPDGVLLLGTGVCQSYANAYSMLCAAAGLDCIYVSGSAGTTAPWGPHGWNMVKLDGVWYHVDCTWDDPGEGGGFENHDYFCVDDETLSKDHQWNRSGDVNDATGVVAPESNGGEYEHTEASPGDYDFTFSTWDEFGTRLDEMIAAGERRAQTIGLYTGSESLSDMYTAMDAWGGEKAQSLANQGLVIGWGRGYAGKLFTYRLAWNNPTSYLRIKETDARLSAGEKLTLTISEIEPAQNVFSWTSSDPSVATVSASFANGTITATVTGVAPGSATITATSDDGATDSVAITVMEPYAPEFDLKITETDEGTLLTWNTIPGATCYNLVRVFEGEYIDLATVTSASAILPSQQLPSNVKQDVYIVARRIIDGKALNYTSETVSYGEYAFDYTAVLPTSVTTIESEAFLNNTSLTAVDISSQVSSIGDLAFHNCSALTAVRIPDSVISIGEYAFLGCPLEYAEVVEGSYADEWMKEFMHNVILVY